MGDLVATCSSPMSRNRTYGENLGRGMSLADAAAHTTQVTEGVKSAGPVLELAKDNAVEMPITEVVAGVTSGQIEIGQAAVLLASRSAKPERYGV
jgi:glycerol-3-phosphate dehydrogenase (NAD(P)+)